MTYQLDSIDNDKKFSLFIMCYYGKNYHSLSGQPKIYFLKTSRVSLKPTRENLNFKL